MRCGYTHVRATSCFDQTPVTNNAGSMAISDGALLPLSGIVNNTGTIELNSSGNGTTLELIQSGVTLEGGGRSPCPTAPRM